MGKTKLVGERSVVVQSSLETESWIVKQNFWDNEIVFDAVAVKDIYIKSCRIYVESASRQ